MILSWMNDSGFWVVQRLSGFTEKETLKTWTVMLTAISVAGLLQVLVMAKVLPMIPDAKPVPAKKESRVSSIPTSGLVVPDGRLLHRRR